MKVDFRAYKVLHSQDQHESWFLQHTKFTFSRPASVNRVCFSNWQGAWYGDFNSKEDACRCHVFYSSKNQPTPWFCNKRKKKKSNSVNYVLNDVYCKTLKKLNSGDMQNDI